MAKEDMLDAGIQEMWVGCPSLWTWFPHLDMSVYPSCALILDLCELQVVALVGD